VRSAASASIKVVLYHAQPTPLPAAVDCRGIGFCSVVTDSARLGTYCSNCNVTLTARDRLKPSKNPNSQEGTITT
jgi:hypothetical protein